MDTPVLSVSYTLSIVDYVILGVSVVLVLGIAVWTGFKNKNTTQDFFTARESIGPFPVAMSFLSTFISGYMIMAYAGEMYGYGLEFAMAIIGGVIGIVCCTYINLKVFFDLKLNTVYEYFELRYKSFGLRLAMMILQVLNQVAMMGIASTGPCLILAAVTPVDIEVYCVIVGILCAFYATVGGMRGVIWTDTIMMIIMTIGMLAVITVGSMYLGPSKIWSIASEGGRTQFFNFSPTLYQRHNTILLFIHGFLLYGNMYGTSQVSLQRALSLRSFADYRKALIILAVSYIIMHAVIFGTGLVAYALYVECDPISSGKIRSLDQILPYMISDKLNAIQGVSGLFLASMICAGVSTVSSMMNSIANLLYGDVLLKLDSVKKLSDKHSLLICKSMTMLMALPAIGISLMVSKAPSMNSIAMMIFGIFLAPVIGVFFLALLFPMSRLSGGVVGFFASLGLLLWFAFGRMLSGSPDPFLPLSTKGCAALLAYNTTDALAHGNFSIDVPTEKVMNRTDSMYNVSYTFFSVFGTITCLGVGLIVSFFNGLEKVENVPEEYISGFLRNFYYKNIRNTEVTANHNAKSTKEDKNDSSFL